MPKRLFDPRFDQWPEHFAFSPTKGYGVIIGLTAIGAETVRAMRFHESGPEGALAERYAAILRGRWVLRTRRLLPAQRSRMGSVPQEGTTMAIPWTASAWNCRSLKVRSASTLAASPQAMITAS
jgi:hypothetical protein